MGPHFQAGLGRYYNVYTRIPHREPILGTIECPLKTCPSDQDCPSMVWKKTPNPKPQTTQGPIGVHTCRLIPCSFLGTLFWAQESTTIKLGTLRKRYCMSLQVECRAGIYLHSLLRSYTQAYI